MPIDTPTLPLGIEAAPAGVTVTPLQAADRAAWAPLFAGYAAFYGVAQTPEMAATTWDWLMDPTHMVEGVLARRADGTAVGLAHFRAMPSPLRGAVVGFLDDLFVDPAARGGGAAAALIGHVAAEARARGWAKLRWITADDNYRARGFYDRVAGKTLWNVYELIP